MNRSRRALGLYRSLLARLEEHLNVSLSNARPVSGTSSGRLRGTSFLLPFTAACRPRNLPRLAASLGLRALVHRELPRVAKLLGIPRGSPGDVPRDPYQLPHHRHERSSRGALPPGVTGSILVPLGDPALALLLSAALLSKIQTTGLLQRLGVAVFSWSWRRRGPGRSHRRGVGGSRRRRLCRQQRWRRSSCGASGVTSHRQQHGGAPDACPRGVEGQVKSRPGKAAGGLLLLSEGATSPLLCYR